MKNPKKPGLYLACVYEWAGYEKDRPAKPQWVIKRYCIETEYVPGWGATSEVESEYWQKQEYRYDTGNLENLEVIAWQELPPLPGENPKLKTGDMIPKKEALERIEAILEGIDKEEASADNGWWETSKGATFGKERLAKIRALLS